jgi:hypothetical protein
MCWSRRAPIIYQNKGKQASFCIIMPFFIYREKERRRERERERQRERGGYVCAYVYRWQIGKAQKLIYPNIRDNYY